LIEFIKFIWDNLFIILFILSVKLISHFLNTFSINYSFTYQFLWVSLKYIRLILYYLIHFWLSKTWLILLIMSPSSISNNIDKNILFEFLSISYSNFHALIKNIWLITIHMNNWNINCFGNFSTIEWWSTLMWIRCETYLIIKNYVNDSSRTIIN
jgi:hypothetical protein